MASPQKTSRKAAGTRAAIRRARPASGRAHSGDAGDDIGLDALVGHAGYAVRRFQLWIFQDFIKTLATVDIRPTQYSVMTVIGANPGLSQMAVAKRLGIGRASVYRVLGKPEAIKARLAEQIAALLETSDRFDADRLSQEAILIATKADIREELDRIASHIGQAREMIGKGGPVGRRLDFLAQEFNREVNTCCSKSNDVELTNTGLEMKNVVEQFREQVQNLE